jgi:hypothetical protein
MSFEYAIEKIWSGCSVKKRRANRPAWADAKRELCSPFRNRKGATGLPSSA